MKLIRNKFYFKIGLFTVAILLFGLLSIATVLSILGERLYISPSNEFEFYAYNDKKENGNSFSSLEKGINGQLTHFYRLGDSLQYPFCGFVAQKPQLEFFSTSGKVIKMQIISDTAVRIPIGIHVYLPGFTKRHITETFLFLEKMVIVQKGINEISIPVEEMYVPTWWYTLNNITENDLPDYDLEKTTTITFSNDQFLKPGFSRKLTFSNIRLEPDLFYLLITGSVAAAATVIIFAIITYLKKRKRLPIYIPIKQQEVEENQNNLLEKIKNYISKNYHNPELRVRHVAKEIGASENKVGAVLKENTAMTFSEYLNLVRIEESKRLLKETGLPVSDISFKVGYEYPQNFNRVFKKVTGSTPKDFRANKELIGIN